MKKIIIALAVFLVLSVACGETATQEEQPNIIVEKFIEAVRNENGEVAAGYLSSDLISEFCVIGSYEEVVANPEASSENLVNLGITLTPDEIATMTEKEYVILIFSTDVMSSQLESLGSAEIGEAAIVGTTATVPVTTNGSTELFEFVHEDNSWKINSFL